MQMEAAWDHWGSGSGPPAMASGSGGRGLGLRVAEGQDGDEDEAHEDKGHGEAGALPESPGQVDHHDDGNDEAHDGDEHEDDPPARAAGDLAHEVEVVNGDDGSPAGLARLFKDLPEADDDQQDDGQVDEARNQRASACLDVL